MKVQNMISRSSGRPVANQFIISDNVTSRTIFQSYDSMIVTLDYHNKTISLGANWNYSMTTSKYRNQFFDEQGFSGLASTKGLTEALKTGKYEDWTIITA